MQDIYQYSSHDVNVKHQEWSHLKRAFNDGDLSPYLIGGEMDLPVIAELPGSLSIRHNRSAIKSLQLRVANALLLHGSGMHRERMNKEEE